jgi:ABC-2 type transport system permease protein
MNMFQRIKLVAAREFLVTVSSKGFLIGVLIMPLIMVALIALIPKLLSQRGAQMNVEVAFIDQSMQLSSALGTELTPAVIAARRDEGRREAVQQLGETAGRQVADAALPLHFPTFRLKTLPANATIEEQKAWLTDDEVGKRERRALVLVPANAVTRAADAKGYGSYEFYAPRNLPEDAEGILHGALRQVLVAERLRSAGFDPEVVKAATDIPRTRTTLISSSGKQQGAQGLNRMLPFIMGILLFMGVMIGGQALMTSTVEEKSSRVVEVLLAAVSPLELMWGKLLGQLGVGLVTMAVYVTLGILALLQFAMIGLLDPMLIVWLIVFFLITYLVFGALMLAVGAAVNQIADAQSLMGPIMILMMIPYMLTPIIGRTPDSMIAIVSSFVPPVNSFAMLARLASSSPPPVWQVLLSVLSGLVGACIAVWFAAKVFRIGLLMHGKPPSFATMIKWARMS